MTPTPEERLLRDIDKRVEQFFLNRTTELEHGADVAASVSDIRKRLQKIHNSRFEQIRILREFVEFLVAAFEDEEALLDQLAATEGHASEVFVDSQNVLEDWRNIETLLNNIGVIYEMRNERLNDV